jgi:O-acetyl-ADP-ribose deacetylase (regulator of RNase III)
MIEPGLFVTAPGNLKGKVLSVSGETALVELTYNNRVEYPLASLRPPANFQIVSGDLLDADTQYIAHQCNCVSKGVSGIAAAIFAKWPEANVYKERLNGVNHKARFASYTIHGHVINLYSQINPGKPAPSGNDSANSRLGAFKYTLTQIMQIPGLTSIGFPYRIGCGLAGGNWPEYLHTLSLFAHRNPKVAITIFKKG